jgi:hypothetical protein
MPLLSPRAFVTCKNDETYLPYNVQPEEKVVRHRDCVFVVPHCTHDLLGCMLWGQLRDPVHAHIYAFTSTGKYTARNIQMFILS